MDPQHISWGVVSKMLCGNVDFIKEVLSLGVMEIHDARISNLRAVKKLNPAVQTVYIKPPAEKNIKKVVEYADVSFNTEFATIQKLSEEAQRQKKTHKIIIMIEMGDLREGVVGDHLIEFYGSIFKLPNIDIVGIGTNLNCLHGVMPSEDKLIQLSLYKQLIEVTFSRKIPWVSGGTSVVFPLLLHNQLPKGINHFRIGELLYFGTNLFSGDTVPGMTDEVFTLYAQIIELTEKPKIPMGDLAANPSGEVFEVDESDFGKTSYRAILDLGLLDSATEYLVPFDSELIIIGASSDMIVMDLEQNPKAYKVGDWIPFKVKYMGALALMNSDYIEKSLSD